MSDDQVQEMMNKPDATQTSQARRAEIAERVAQAAEEWAKRVDSRHYAEPSLSAAVQNETAAKANFYTELAEMKAELSRLTERFAEREAIYKNQIEGGAARIESLTAQVEGLATALQLMVDLDECEAHFEEAYERVLPIAQAALASRPAREEGK